MSIVIPDKTPIQGAAQVSIVPTEGSGFISVSPNICDRTTWYPGAIEVIDQAMTLKSGLIYETADTHWIDLVNGKQYDEDNINSDGKYTVAVKDNGVEVTSGITIDYVAGEVTFDSAPTTPVTVSYYKAGSSEFTIAPDAGKVVLLEHAELQFSDDLVIDSPLLFEVWVYNPYDLPNKVKHSTLTYKNVKDLIASGNLGTGVIKQVGDLPSDIWVLPWNYLASKPLQSSFGAELRLKVKDDVELTGSWACATLYCLSRDE